MTLPQLAVSKSVLVAVLLLAALILFVPPPIKIRTRIYNTVVVDRPPAMVFDYVTTPRNWPVWHPSSLAVSGATGHAARIGEAIEEAFSVAGFRGKVRWTVVVHEPPHRWVIDGKVARGGEGRISYTLNAEGEGTLFEREFDYLAPNLLFVILDRIFVRERIYGESEEALRRLKAVLER